MNIILQKRIEEKSEELGQKYFPNEMNIWARNNYEAQYVENACKEIAHFALQNQWISVEEALPKEFEKVFFRAVGKNDTICFGIGYVDIEYWYTDIQRDEQDYFNFEITHWMLIPELPKGGWE